MLENTLSYSVPKIGDLDSLIYQVSKQANENVLQALQIIKNTIEKGITPIDEKPIREAFETIRQQEPSTLRHLVDVMKGSVSGAAGNLLYSWIAPIVAALPK